MVTLHDVESAAARLRGRIRRTASVDSPALSEFTGASVTLKLENRQTTGSFKDRGALNCLELLDPVRRAGGVIAMSAGNHAQAVAYGARAIGVAATIVMPETTPFFKVRRTKEFGATVVLHGQTLAESTERAFALADERGLTFIHPYDDPAIVAGQGTVALEMIEDAGPLDAVIVPVGGGGLLAGTLVAYKALAPQTQIIGIETQAFPSLAEVLAGRSGEASGAQTVAEGIAVKTIGKLPLEIARALVDDVLTVGDREIEQAIHLFLENEKLVVEGAGAASLACLLAQRERFAGKRVGLIVSGGNIDTGLLASVIARIRLREHRVHLMRVEIPDQPGTLARVASVVSSIGANILEVGHQRQFSEISAKSAYLMISFETQRPEDAEEVISRLAAAGFPATIQA